MKRGWVRIYRKLRNNPYMKKPAYRAVWIELLLEATYNDEEKYTMWKGERIKLNPGQFTVGCKQLSEWTGVPRGTVQRILKCFETESQMSIETSNQYSLISILNWGLYQPLEKKVSNEMSKERVTNEQPMGTPKEVNNKELINIVTAWNKIKLGDTKWKKVIKITDDLLESYITKRKSYKTYDELHSDFAKAIARYGKDIASRNKKSDYANHRFTLKEFLKQSNAFLKFLNNE